jgi:hypothetical protein
MIRVLTLLLSLIAVAFGALLCGLLSNWFRYELSLEATLVLATALAAVLVTGGTAYVAYRRASAVHLGAAALAMAAGIGLVLVVHHQAIGGLPRFYLAHTERSPHAVLQTRAGAVTYWIELENPFSSRHEEFLVVASPQKKRIRIEALRGPAGGFASAAVPEDWGTLSMTDDPGVVILTLGRHLSASSEQFRIDLGSGVAHRLR